MFSDLEVVALSQTAETENIDSEKWLFGYKLQEHKDGIPFVAMIHEPKWARSVPNMGKVLALGE